MLRSHLSFCCCNYRCTTHHALSFATRNDEQLVAQHEEKKIASKKKYKNQSLVVNCWSKFSSYSNVERVGWFLRSLPRLCLTLFLLQSRLHESFPKKNERKKIKIGLREKIGLLDETEKIVTWKIDRFLERQKIICNQQWMTKYWN